MHAYFSQLKHLSHSSPGFSLENILSQNLHVMFLSSFVSMSGVDFINCFLGFDPHFPKSCFFERLGQFRSKVGLLLSVSSLKYGFEGRIVVFPHFWPLLFTEVSAFGTCLMPH
jgi:hypothetical protein